MSKVYKSENDKKRKRLKRQEQNRAKWEPKEKQWELRGGVRVYKDKLGYYKLASGEYLHTKIYQAHHGRLPVRWTVWHLNGDRSDNRLSNLIALPHDFGVAIDSEAKKSGVRLARGQVVDRLAKHLGIFPKSQPNLRHIEGRLAEIYEQYGKEIFDERDHLLWQRGALKNRQKRGSKIFVDGYTMNEEDYLETLRVEPQEPQGISEKIGSLLAHFQDDLLALCKPSQEAHFVGHVFPSP